MRRSLMGLALSFSLALGLTTAAQAADDIAVGFVRATAHAPYMVGIEKGIYAKHDLNVVPKFYTSGIDSLQGLLTGEQKITTVGAFPFLIAVSKGIDVVAIGMIESQANEPNFTVTSLLTAPSAGVTSAADLAKLKGKKVGLLLGTASEDHMGGLLDTVGLTPKDVEYVNLAPAKAVTALQTGAVDAINVWEPWTTVAEKTIPGTTLVVNGAGPCVKCFNTGFMVVARKTLEEEPALLERFWIAHAEAMKYARTHSDETADVASRWIEGVNIDILKAAMKRANMDPRMTKNIEAGLVNDTMPFLVKAGLLKAVFDPKPNLDYDIYKKVAAEHPDLFDDMQPVKPEYKLD